VIGLAAALATAVVYIAVRVAVGGDPVTDSHVFATVLGRVVTVVILLIVAAGYGVMWFMDGTGRP
jgi:hypothetical protein